MLYLRQNVPGKLDSLEPLGNLIAFLDKVLKILVGQFVSGLKAPVVRAGLLNGVVCKVYELVFKLVIRDAVLLRARSNVSLFIKVTPGDTIGADQHSVYPNVELPLVDQQWSIDVALHNESVLLLRPKTSDILLMVAGIDLSAIRLTKCNHFVQLRLTKQIFACPIYRFLLGEFDEIAYP